MKKAFCILLLIYPSVINAQTAGLGVSIFSSMGYFLFGGLILGFLEASIFRTLSESMVSLRKIILFNYLILILAYLVFILFVYINGSFFPITTDSIRERIATIKLIISITIYFGIVIEAKYLVYSKKKIIDFDGKNLFLLLLIPNIIFIGLYFGLLFQNLVWWFSE